MQDLLVYRVPLRPMDSGLSFVRLKDVIYRDNLIWNLGLVENLIFDKEIITIKKIPIGINEHDDKLLWPHAKDGSYFVK